MTIQELIDEDLDAEINLGAHYYGSMEQYYLHVKARHKMYTALKDHIEKRHPWTKESTK